MSRTHRNRAYVRAGALLAAAAIAVLGLAARPLMAQQRIVAVGDVHGAYESFVAVLRAARLVDGELRWSGGDARLVVLGDVLDRGAGSRAALDLIMKLQREAAEAGGGAELVLGNHEVMNLVGDLRYVVPGEFAAYAADEPVRDRDAAWSRFRSQFAGDERSAREEFAARFPPGFFGHRTAFTPRGRYGAWLLERPVLVVLGQSAFVHGGLPAAIAGKTPEAVSAEHRAALRAYLAAVDTLTRAGVLYPENDIVERARRVARFVNESTLPASDPLLQAAALVRDFASSPLLGADAAFWYRGTAACSPAIERGRLAALLRGLGADRVVIGHTPTPAGRVLTRFAGSAIRADTGAVFGGEAAAVVLDAGNVSVIYAANATPVAPTEQQRAVGVRVAEVGDDALEQLLSRAAALTRTPRADGTELWQLDLAGSAATAIFRPALRRGVLPEVAAYRLDRLLDLELVPVTVRRELDGRVGSLTLDASALPSETQRRSEGTADSWCPLLDQFNAMYAFDVLAGSSGRSQQAMRYRREDGALTLTDNGSLFGTNASGPPYLEDVSIAVPPHLATRLASLTEAALAESLGDVLDARRRRAILERRDRLLKSTSP